MFGTNDYFHIMKKVYYALYHVYEDEQANKDEEKFIGLFSTARKARQVIEELRYLPGFNKFPKKNFELYHVEIHFSIINDRMLQPGFKEYSCDCFIVTEIFADEYRWKKGFESTKGRDIEL